MCKCVYGNLYYMLCKIMKKPPFCSDASIVYYVNEVFVSYLNV